MNAIEGLCIVAFIGFVGLCLFIGYALAVAGSKADDELTRTSGIDHG